MNYSKIYNKIILKAKTKQYDLYTERHHIVPKCLGGDNKKSNIVCLSYSEHFIRHWLLCKMYPDNHKLKAAFAKMLGGSQRVTSGGMFEAVKRNLKDLHYEWLQNKEPWNKGKVGVQKSWNKGKKLGPLSEEEKKRRSKVAKEYWSKHEHPRKNKAPWNKNKVGVQIPWNKDIMMPKQRCSYCQKECDPMNLKKWHNEKCKQKPAAIV